jgi:2-isopropylmalate synthase
MYVEQRANAIGERVTVSMAVVKVTVGEEKLISAAERQRPVNALDLALRKDLDKYQIYIKGLNLTSAHPVHILDAGNEAVTRVLMESEDENGEHWTTIGVSPNIIDASFQALMDSIVYKLVKSGAPAWLSPPRISVYFDFRVWRFSAAHRRMCDKGLPDQDQVRNTT